MKVLGVTHQFDFPDYTTAERVFASYFILFILFIDSQKVYSVFSLLKPLQSSAAAAYSSNPEGVLWCSHVIV